MSAGMTRTASRAEAGGRAAQAGSGIQAATASGQAPQPTAQFDAGSFISSLSRTLAAANRFLVAQLRHQGLTDLVPSHGDILACLFEGAPLTMQQLAERINRDPSTVTALVRKLAAAGYVSTRKAESDRRITQVSLTAKGRRLRPAFQAITERLLEAQMRDIDTADFDTTCRTLQRVRRNLTDALGEADL